MDDELLARLKGRTVLDLTTNQPGVVMDVINGSVYLRPVGGGIEWQRSPRHIEEPVEGVCGE